MAKISTSISLFLIQEAKKEQATQRRKLQLSSVREGKKPFYLKRGEAYTNTLTKRKLTDVILFIIFNSICPIMTPYAICPFSSRGSAVRAPGQVYRAQEGRWPGKVYGEAAQTLGPEGPCLPTAPAQGCRE